MSDRYVFDLNGVGRKRVTQQMRLEDDWFSCAGLKGHAMQEETHTGRNGLIFQMLMSILEEIRSLPETMTSPIVGMVSHLREGIARLQSVVVAKHARRFFNEPDRFLSDPIVVKRVCPLTLWQEAQEIADTRRWIFCAWRSVIEKLNEAVR